MSLQSYFVYGMSDDECYVSRPGVFVLPLVFGVMQTAVVLSAEKAMFYELYRGLTVFVALTAINLKMRLKTTDDRPRRL